MKLIPLLCLTLATIFAAPEASAAKKRAARAPRAEVSEFDRRVRLGQERREAQWRAEEAARPKVDHCAPKYTEMTTAIARGLGLAAEDMIQYPCGFNRRNGQVEFVSRDQFYICRLDSEMGIGWAECVDSNGTQHTPFQSMSIRKLPRWY